VKDKDVRVIYWFIGQRKGRNEVMKGIKGKKKRNETKNEKMPGVTSPVPEFQPAPSLSEPMY
jgi:hypothetical protein